MGFQPGSQDLARPCAAPFRQRSPLGSRAELTANEGEHTQRGNHRNSEKIGVFSCLLSLSALGLHFFYPLLLL